MPFLSFFARPLFLYLGAAAVVLGLLGSLYGVGRSHGRASERASWEAVRAEENRLAAQALSDRLAENAAKEAISAARNAALEKEVSDAREETTAAHGAYNRALSARVRQPTCPPANSTPGGPETGGAGSGEKLAPEPGLFVSEAALRDIGDLFARADNTESVMKACQAWSLANGR